MFGTHNTINVLERVISSLNDGVTQDNYSFSLPNKFGFKLAVADRFVVSKYEDYSEQIDRLVFSSEEKHNALAILYLPLMSDLYYPLKAKLAHFGRVSQVVSTTSFDIYVAWNIGTNIAAKFGYIPWGISESPELPNADMVLGFAYSSLKSDGRIRRNIGHVNVFDRNGVWRFVQSSSDYLDFEKRLKVIPQMVKNAIVGFLASGGTPRMIDIHYSKRFSYQERLKTFEAIRAVAPSISEVNFVSIDKTHPLRVFDSLSSNLNLGRGSIIELGPSEFLLSVAGEDKPGAPASRLLKIKVWRAPISSDRLDLKTIAYRVIAMTKLNWRSAVRETSEPVTLKYSEEIARLTNHFSITEWNTVNNQLSKIPWFI